MIDHTLLKATATEKEISLLCAEALDYGFACVCVNPSHVSLAVSLLKNTPVHVCSVIGFPLGATGANVKVYEANNVINCGATEIDMVMNIGALKEGRPKTVLEEIKEVVRAARNRAIVKVIIETCFLTQKEKILACNLASEAGADYVKTSTGYGSHGAVAEDVILLRNTLPQRVKVKASGGIRSLSQALDMIRAGAERIGTSSGNIIMKELLSTVF